MKKSITFFCFIISICFDSTAYAATGERSGKIQTILWYEGHTGVLIVQDNMSDLGGCGRSDYYILDGQHAYFKEIYSLILSAHIINQPLTLSIQDCVQGISRIKHVSSIK
jgi:hypothetical protein